MKVAPIAFSVVTLRSYETGYHHVECYNALKDVSNMTTSCCHQVFFDDDISDQLCVAHAVTFPPQSQVMSFFHSAKPTKTSTAVWREGAWQDDVLPSDVSFSNGQVWNVSLVGVGMHRELRFEYNANVVDSGAPLVHYYQYLPACLFINVEEHEDDGLKILHTAPTIDQEEPVFASVPHGLTITGISKTSWTLKLHARYPMPSSPLQCVFPIAASTSDGDQQWIVWDVASPDASDTLPVLVTTVVIALIGAAVTFRDIQRVVKWV